MGFVIRSSQSRADLLALGLAVTNLLTGLVWLSIRPKTITPVEPEGVDCKVLEPNLPASILSELLWYSLSLSLSLLCVKMNAQHTTKGKINLTHLICVSGLGNLLRWQHVVSLWLLSTMAFAFFKSGWLLNLRMPTKQSLSTLIS